MSVRKKSTFRKFTSKLKRGGKRSVIAITSIPFIPIRLTGNTIKVVGENLEFKGDRRMQVGEPLKQKGMVWRGRAYKLVGNSVSLIGNTVFYPVLIFDDHTNNIKARMDLEARMDGVGWQTATVRSGQEYMPQGATKDAMAFVPKNDQAVSEEEAMRTMNYER